MHILGRFIFTRTRFFMLLSENCELSEASLFRVQCNAMQRCIEERRLHTSLDAYASVINRKSDDRELGSGTGLHAHLIINGLIRRIHIASKLISFYIACGKAPDARQLFDEIPKTNIRRWIALVGAYARYGFYGEAVGLFQQMQRDGIRHNVFVVPSVLKACAHLHERWTGEIVHAVIVKHSFDFDAFVVTALIDMYSKTGQVDKARKVFDDMEPKDLVALNALVSGYAQFGFPVKALGLVEKTGLMPNLLTWNSLIVGFAHKGDQVRVTQLLHLMRAKGIEPDVVSWTSVISGFVHNFQNKQAFSTFKQMLARGFRPNSATISTLLSACSAVANVRLGKEIHGNALSIGIEEDVFVRTALVDMYGKCGFINEATTLFFKMSKRNTVTWNSMIFGYANNGYCDEAIQLFNQMSKDDEVKPDHLTFTAVLTACSHARLIDVGQSLFQVMQEKYRIVPRVEHYACAVDLLGRAGKLSEAYEMIKEMPVKADVFVWGALLGACNIHGNIHLAEVAAKHLVELDPKNAANHKLLTSLHAHLGNWANVATLKNTINTKKFPASSWIQMSTHVVLRSI